MQINCKYLLIVISAIITYGDTMEGNNNIEYNKLSINNKKVEGTSYKNFIEIVSSFSENNNQRVNLLQKNFIKLLLNEASTVSKDKSNWYCEFVSKYKSLTDKKKDIKRKLVAEYNLSEKQLSFIATEPIFQREVDKIKLLLNLNERAITNNGKIPSKNFSEFSKQWSNVLAFSNEINEYTIKEYIEQNCNELGNKILELNKVINDNEKISVLSLYILLMRKSKELGMLEFVKLFKARKDLLILHEKLLPQNISINSSEFLSHLRISNWKNINNDKDKELDDDENNNYCQSYNNFINSISNYCSGKKCENLLKCLLYINVYDTFNTIRNNFIINQETNNRTGGRYRNIREASPKESENREFADYLLGKNNLSDLFNKYGDYEDYSKRLQIIKEIINVLAKEMMNNYDEQKVKSEILAIITQGIHDNTILNGKNKKYEDEPLQMSISSINTINNEQIDYKKILSQETIKYKIDKEFDITNIVNKYSSWLNTISTKFTKIGRNFCCNDNNEE